MLNTTPTELLQAVENEIQFREQYARMTGLDEQEKEELIADVELIHGWLSDGIDDQLGAVLDAHYMPIAH
jgi:hypothetical protein